MAMYAEPLVRFALRRPTQSCGTGESSSVCYLAVRVGSGDWTRDRGPDVCGCQRGF